jgi:regulator of replication initiation timing
MPPALLPELVAGPLSSGFQTDILSLIAVIGALVAIWAVFRRKPPIDSELVKLQLSIENLQQAVTDLVANQRLCGAHRTETADLKRRLGELETRRESDSHAQRTYTRESAHDIFSKLDATKDALAVNIQAVERAVGRVEGEMKSIGERMGRLETANLEMR